MKNETMNKLQIGLVVFATVVLIVMNVFTFGAVAMVVLRTILALSWIGYGILPIINRKIKSQGVES